MAFSFFRRIQRRSATPARKFGRVRREALALAFGHARFVVAEDETGCPFLAGGPVPALALRFADAPGLSLADRTVGAVGNRCPGRRGGPFGFGAGTCGALRETLGLGLCLAGGAYFTQNFRFADHLGDIVAREIVLKIEENLQPAICQKRFPIVFVDRFELIECLKNKKHLHAKAGDLCDGRLDDFHAL